jgi:hypothetical protein
MHDLVAVAKHFGYDWRRHLGDEFSQRGVPGTQQVDAEPPKAIHQCGWVQVLAGSVSRK